MAEFDFSTLNSSDLEELVCDLLNANEIQNKTKILFKTFKDGKDKGIDLLYSTKENEYEIVGQVKHYYRSGFALMLKELIDKEKDKVVKLNPNKYIFATSVDLSVFNSVEIMNTFTPYIESVQDVYGKKDLNRFIELYEDVLHRHFKLWYSSTEVLRKIIKYEIEGRSNEFKERFLKRRIRLYVNTPVFEEAKAKLEKSNFVIITGEPGAGKTTAAELLLYDYLRNDFELSYVYDDIKEIERVLREDDSKQIFYFDDFLGHNAYEIAKAKGSETAFLRILQRINRANNKKIIFTTRTFILNEAVEESERLRRFNLKARESILKLEAYTLSMKAEILKNHIDESEIDEKLKDVISEKLVSNFIINHRNFSPRSVEYITSSENISDFSVEEYRKFIIGNFNNPDEIWRHAYEQQISDIDRFLINTMVSFGDSVDIRDLELAFNYRLDYEVKQNNIAKPMNAFKTSFKKIESGFIVQETHNLNFYKFINPSLVDFLIKYLQNDSEEVKRISESAFFLDQLTRRIFPFNKRFSNSVMTKDVEKRLLYDYKFFLGKNTGYYGEYEPIEEVHDRNSDLLELAIVINTHINNEESERIVCEILGQITNWGFIDYYDYIRFHFYIFLKNLSSDTLIAYFNRLGLPVFVPIIVNESSSRDVLDLLDLIETKFNIDISSYINTSDEYGISDHVSTLLEQKIEQDVEDLLGYSMAQDFVDDKEKETKELVDEFVGYGLIIRVNLAEYGRYDWWEIGNDNYVREQMEKDD